MKARVSSLFLLAACLMPYAAHTAERFFTFSSGTGFFINDDGYLLTNQHVLSSCDTNIMVYGTNMSAGAELVASDPVHDLALLKSDFASGAAASFSSFKAPLNIGDPVVVLGFPGQSWQVHEAVLSQAKIIDTKGPNGDENWLQFTDSLRHGNSGGPLLDEAGNVIGVVAAKAEMYEIDPKTQAPENMHTADMAISWPVVRKFLQDNHVQYQEADSGIYLSPDRVAEHVRASIVNVRCRYR